MNAQQPENGGAAQGTDLLARRMKRVAPSAIMEILKAVAAADVISFASGLPDPSLYPTDAIRGIVDDILTSDGRAALQYGPAEGVPALREWVAGCGDTL